VLRLDDDSLDLPFPRSGGVEGCGEISERPQSEGVAAVLTLTASMSVPTDHDERRLDHGRETRYLRQVQVRA
jgi:hypothetical protein